MNILLVQPTGDKMGHYGIYTSKLCQAFGELGHSVTLCTNRIFPERYVQGPPAFEIHQVSGGSLGFEKFDQNVKSRHLYYLWGYFRNSYLVGREALKLSQDRKFDIIYIMDTEFLLASFLLKRYSGKIPPVVMYVSAANFSFRDYPGSILKKTYKIFQRQIFKSTIGREIQAIAVLGEWHEERLRHQLGLSEDFPVAVIPDGGGDAVTPLNKDDARRALGIKYGGPMLLFFGMLRKDKGLEGLIKAISTLKSEEFRLVIAGYPMEYSPSQVSELIQASGVEDKVILRLGYVDDADVPNYFYGCDGMVMPYAGIYTGGSGPLLKQAGTYSLPVIASDVSEMGRLVKEYSIGLVSPPGNPSALADNIRQFLAMPAADREKMGKAASALANSNSWEVMAERFSDLFEGVAGAKARWRE